MMIDEVKKLFEGRPHWMNALMLFCAYMTFIYMPFDMFYKPVEEDVEVWFGFMLHGWAAKATEPIHWAIYGAGFYGFLKMKSWMHPWAALYVFQVAIAMGLWGILNEEIQNVNPVISLSISIPFIILGVMIWRRKALFQGEEEAPVEAPSDSEQSEQADQ